MARSRDELVEGLRQRAADFNAVSPRDGSMGDSHAAAMLAPHAWAEVQRLRRSSTPLREER